jgi:hypothetical protein
MLESTKTSEVQTLPGMPHTFSAESPTDLVVGSISHRLVQRQDSVIKGWKRATQGIVEQTNGKLAVHFPGLRNLPLSAIKRMLEETR